jgi:hypothetical protein
LTFQSAEANPEEGDDRPRREPDVNEDRLPAALFEAPAQHGNARSFRANAILINEATSATRSTSC